MEPLIQQANQEFGLHIKRLDIASPSNYALLIKLDKVAHCGGLPFFYNLKTHRHICGATTYQNLVAWATGKPSGTIIPPPMKEEEIRATYRKTVSVANESTHHTGGICSNYDKVKRCMYRYLNVYFCVVIVNGREKDAGSFG
uniref:Uncharacterized protein n=1 Tax=Babesia bovis TaxID=5865 RepID=A7AU43_BABBO|eukprot:XP_001610022.1 hypothetical protein [Babesia bovis T2Bo]